MHEGDFHKTKEAQELAGFLKRDEFNFGSEIHRLIMTHDPSFTYGHYRVGDGQATVGGVRFGNKLYYSVALCAPADNFSKSIGRTLVRSHLISAENSHKRGVIVLDGDMAETVPAQLLKLALEHHLDKMHHRPNWAKGVEVDFRMPQKTGKKPGVGPSKKPVPLSVKKDLGWDPEFEEQIRRPHGGVRRPGSR